MSSPSPHLVLTACVTAIAGTAAVAAALVVLPERPPTVIALPGPTAAAVDPPGTPRGFTASGTATIEAAPDVAELVATIEVERSRPQAAAREVRTKADGLVAALAGAGVARADVALSQLQLAPVHETVDPRLGITRVRGHRAAVVVTITTRDFEAIAGLMEVAAGAGASSVSSQFRVADLAALKRKVRAMAAAAARDKAREVADALDISLGEVRAIVEHPGDGWSWNGTYANAVEVAAPIAAAHGDVQRITMSIDVTYDLGASAATRVIRR